MRLISSVLSKKLKESFALPEFEGHKYRIERLAQLKKISSFAASYYVSPLFLIFSIADWMYYPANYFLFLGFRIFTVVSIVLLNKRIQKSEDLTSVQRLCTVFVFTCSAPLTAMVLIIGDMGSPYYAGLMLVIIGMSSGFRFTWNYYLTNIFLTIAPFLLVGPMIYGATTSNYFYLSSLFVIGSSLISTVSRAFHEKLYDNEFYNRKTLENEVVSRNAIIEKQTSEAIRLEGMSRQFSPQLVDAMKAGKIKLNQDVHRAKICAIFIDIVNSTERITRIDKDKVNKVIELFMEDTIKVLLKYDITVDKFLGDGVLAFCNDPVEYKDYASRTINAALEIRERIGRRQYIYENYWMNEFQIKIGIADGFANIGFYGSNKYFHSYTAIGPVINLASRLCSSAAPNQIVVSYDVLEKLDIEDYEIQALGKLTLKGFEDDIIKAYAIKGSTASKANPLIAETPDCPSCGSIMLLDNNEFGIFIFKCRSCGAVLDEARATKKAA